MQLSQEQLKLEYFTRAVQQDVATRKQQTLQEAYMQHKKNATATLEAAAWRSKVDIETAKSDLQRAMQKEIALAKSQLINAHVKAKLQLIKDLQADAAQQLLEFTQEPHYGVYIVSQIQKILTLLKPPAPFALVKLTPQDMQHASFIEDAIGLQAIASETEFIGGFILLDAARSIQVDYSFKTLLEAATRDFDLQ